MHTLHFDNLPDEHKSMNKTTVYTCMHMVQCAYILLPPIVQSALTIATLYREHQVRLCEGRGGGVVAC